MRKKIVFAGLLFFTAMLLNAQKADSLADNLYFNSAEKLLRTKGNLKIGGYGGVHYNQPLSSELRNNGKLDVHRFILMMGYQFNDRTQVVTELEYEHVKEIYVEQAFLQYKLSRAVNLRAGLILTPMGIVNEYHEPTVFNGVERPLIDHDIVPSTWREIGLGINGLVLPLSLKYQAYLMNGFNSFDGQAQIGGASGLRGGRQKGAESFVSAPNVTAKVEYFGIRGLNLGLSGYLGETQSTLYNGIDKNNPAALSKADSSVVNLAMLGADGRYSYKGFKLSAQLYYAGLSNTRQYNEFTSNKGGGDLGSSFFGYYVDVAYNVLRNASTNNQLVPFVRYSNFDTHHSVTGIAKNKAYQNDVITSGLSWFLDKGAVLKADVQWVKDGLSSEYATSFNAGFGVMF